MSNTNTNQPVRVPGHPGIYRRSRRYVVRYRDGSKVVSKSFETLAQAAAFKAEQRIQRAQAALDAAREQAR